MVQYTQKEVYEAAISELESVPIEKRSFWMPEVVDQLKELVARQPASEMSSTTPDPSEEWYQSAVITVLGNIVPRGATSYYRMEAKAMIGQAIAEILPIMGALETSMMMGQDWSDHILRNISGWLDSDDERRGVLVETTAAACMIWLREWHGRKKDG